MTQATALESAIERLGGVRSARVVIGDAGIEGVRVLVVPERDSEQTVTEVRSLIHERAGISLKDSQVQVLRTGDAKGLPRRKLASVLTERSGERFTARVTLELAGDVLIGESAVPAGQRFEYRSLARATLDGVGELLSEPLELQSVHLAVDGEDRFAMVVVASGENALIGSAVVRSDEYDAIARATLDAINRLIGRPRTAHAASA